MGIEITEWSGCYSGSWKGIISDHAFAHPAKFSRNLIRRIYEHVIEEGWVSSGDSVLDCFGGTGLGGYDSMQMGLHWLGIELELKFLRLGAGYDCPGFTAEQWRSYRARQDYNTRAGFGLSPYAKYLLWLTVRDVANAAPVDLAMLCADCAAEIEEAETDKQSDLFAGAPHLGRAREAHHFDGNLDLWRRRAFGGSARLIQGDSRKLLEVLSASGNRPDLNSQDLSCSSPPYVSGGHHNDVMGAWNQNGRGQGVGKDEAGYGATEGQMGQMREGEHSLALSSPPYGQRTVHNQSGIDWEKAGRSTLGEGGQHGAPGAALLDGYGNSPGQLARLPASEENHTLAIASPPYGGVSDKHDRTGAERAARRHEEKGFKQGSGSFKTSEAYGRSRGQLGGMDDDDFDVAIMSPPFGSSDTKPGALTCGAASRSDGTAGSRVKGDYEYGDSPGQLGTMEEGDLERELTSTDLKLASRAFVGLGELGAGLCSHSLPDELVRGVFLAIVFELRSCNKVDKIPSRSEGDPGGRWPAALASCQMLLSRLLTNVQWCAVSWTSLLSYAGDCLPCRDSYGELLRSVEESSRVSLPQLSDALHAVYRQAVLGKCSLGWSCNEASPGAGEQLLSGLLSLMLRTVQDNLIIQYRLRSFDTTICSPPYPQPHSGGGGLNVHGYPKDWQKNDLNDLVGRRTYQGRGADREPGNLETLPTGQFDAAISSPPYEKSDVTGDRNFIGGGGRETAAAETEHGYSESEANLGNLPKGDFDSAISSPPYETGADGVLRKSKFRDPEGFARTSAAIKYRNGRPVMSSAGRLAQLERDEDRTYGDDPNNMGNQRGEDFWSASRLILEQLFIALRPGGHAVFIVKRFCRDGVVVDFPAQWAMVCEAVGFKLLHDHHALLTEEHGTQTGFEGDRVVQTSRRSFFRRLYEKKYPENSIDFENVLCFEKPISAQTVPQR